MLLPEISLPLHYCLLFLAHFHIYEVRRERHQAQ